MLGLFEGTKLERGLAACRQVVPLMQGSGLMSRFAVTLLVIRLTPCSGVRSSCEMLSNA